MSLKSRLKRVVKGVAYVSGLPLSLDPTKSAPGAAIEAGQGPLIGSAAVLAVTAGPAIAAELGAATEGASFAATTAADAGVIYPTEATTMSIFSDVLGYAQTGANIYSQVQQARAPSVASPVMTPTMGALPPLVGRALPMIAGAGALVVRGAASIARSAMTYCRRNPAWCASIGGTAAIAGLIESGQLPTIRRRRGRGITPKDLRSFRRVANLVRGFCPTVRRIPSRSLHVRKTGITHA